MKSLAELKRLLTVGAHVTLIKSTIHAPANHKYLNTPRTVEISQTNGVMFSGGSWLYHGKAKDYRFTDHGFIVDCSYETEPAFTQVLEYVLT